MEGLMKTGQIIAITGVVIAGTLLLGGGAFAAGVALSEPIAEERIERIEQRGVDRDELMERRGEGREKGREEAPEHGRGHDHVGAKNDAPRSEQRGSAQQGCDGEHRGDNAGEREYSQHGRPDTAATHQPPRV